MEIMHRHVMVIPEERKEEFLSLQRQIEELEMEAGHPGARHYSPLFSAESTQSLVTERIYNAREFGRLIQERYSNMALQKLEAKRLGLLSWNRQELYYVDTGNPVPRWMKGLSTSTLKEDVFSSLLPVEELAAKGDGKDGKVKVMLRHIQCVRKNKWIEKVEQERLSDQAELNANYPLPIRYRAMCAPMNCHIRIHEREYESYAEMCRLDENFYLSSTSADKRLWGQEVRRQDFVAWESGELYYVLD